MGGHGQHIQYSYSVLTREELGERDGDAQDAAHVPVSAPGQSQTRSDPMPSVTLLLLSLGNSGPVSVLVPFTAPAPDSRRKSDPGPRESQAGARLSSLRGLCLGLTCQICHKIQTEM